MYMLSHVHMGSMNWFGCALVAFTWIRINWCTFNAHLIESTSRSGLDAHSSIIALSAMIHAKLYLPQNHLLARWLGLWCMLYCSSLFCSCIDIEQERGLFLMAKKSSAAWQNNNHNGSIVLQCIVWHITMQSCPKCKCDKPQNSLPALSW